MNTKILIAFVCVAVMAAMANAVPLNFDESLPGEHLIEFEDMDTNAEEYPIHERHRRVTCDLMSVDTPFGSLNHAACAAHCLTMGGGRRGGRCRDGVCHCRY